MYTDFHIQNYRGFHDLHLKNIARVNLIAGMNNTGKTSLLEALFMFGNPRSPELAVRTFNFRGIGRLRFELGSAEENSFASLFGRFETKHPIFFSGTHPIIGAAELHISIVTDPQELTELGIYHKGFTINDSSLNQRIFHVLLFKLIEENQAEPSEYYVFIGNDGIPQMMPIEPQSDFQSIFIPSSTGRSMHNINANRYTRLRIQGKHTLLLDVLKKIEPRLESIELLKFADETILHGDIGVGRPLPLPLMGDGINRAASLILAIADAENGVILIDELENGLHYSVHGQIWEAINHASEIFNCQIFATTHSYDLIRSASSVFHGSDQFAFHRLDRHPRTNEIEVVSYSSDLIMSAVEMAIEVRG